MVAQLLYIFYSTVTTKGRYSLLSLNGPHVVVILMIYRYPTDGLLSAIALSNSNVMANIA